MKKVISIALVIVMMLSFSAVAFAETEGSYQESVIYADIERKCPNGCDTCTGKVGCNCCAACYGALNEEGLLVNIAKLGPCSFGSYIFTDIYDDNNQIVVTGDNKTHYYWKPLCCENCTGLAGCHCDCGCQYCPKDTSNEVGDKIDGAIETGRNGFINGIQTALKAVRDVMYDLFEKLFEFLRLEDILGKKPQFPQ